VSIPLALAEEVRGLEGVRDVVPRIVGQVNLGRDREAAVLIGLPAARMPDQIHCVEGRLPRPGSVHELVIGTEMAERLKLEIGSMLPPFYRNDEGERLAKVVGFFRASSPHWQARLVLTDFDSAAAIFNQRGRATGLLVYCEAGQERQVTRRIRQRDSGNALALGVISRSDLSSLLPRDLLHRQGVFQALYLVVFVVSILATLVTSGAGLVERRREVSILKAFGWQTDEVLLRGFVEGVFLAVAAFALSIVLAFVWLVWFNGYAIAGVFLPGASMAPAFTIPVHLSWRAALFALIVALSVVLCGSLYSTWRAAAAWPLEALR
jgi:ABC-type lipoprotein release transport system permease subunit